MFIWISMLIIPLRAQKALHFDRQSSDSDPRDGLHVEKQGLGNTHSYGNPISLGWDTKQKEKSWNVT